MTGSGGPERAENPDGRNESAAREAEDEAARRRRREQVFGEVLPESTGDDRDDGAEGRSRGNDEWLRSNVPPHHG